MQHSLKSRGTKDHFSQVKVPGIAPLLGGLRIRCKIIIYRYIYHTNVPVYIL